MSVKVNREDKNGLYFITFTCCNWLSLFQMTDSYDVVYKWFNVLRKNNHQIIAYVIMPNHVHVIINFRENKYDIKRWVSNGKRFMAYEIVERLKEKKLNTILKILEKEVTPSDKKRGKKHQVFKSSFDGKIILTLDFLLQKLNYVHSNPVSKKWQLVSCFTDYVDSSARYYEGLDFEITVITHYKDVESLSLISTKRK